MTIFQEWHDFLICPERSGVIWTLEQRLDVAGKRYARCVLCEDEPPIETDECLIVTREHLMGSFPDDEFEMMRVESTGAVTVWSNNHVWCISGGGGIEKLVVVDRNPPVEAQ